MSSTSHGSAGVSVNVVNLALRSLEGASLTLSPPPPPPHPIPTHSSSQPWWSRKYPLEKVRACAAAASTTSSCLNLSFIDAVLRGHGQVIFCDSPVSGAFILLAMLLADIRAGLMGFLGTVVATGTALLFGLDIHAGLFGFNGQLVGMTVGVLVPTSDDRFVKGLAMQCCLCVCYSGLSVVVCLALRNSFTASRLPFLTLPFNIAALWLLTGSKFYSVWEREEASESIYPNHNRRCFRLPSDTDGAGGSVALAAAACPVDVLDQAVAALKAVIESFCQIFLSNSHTYTPFLSGLLIVTGICAFSPIACAHGLLGSGVAAFTAWVLGVDGYEVSLGLWGYNSILTCIAIGGGVGFCQPGWKATALASFAAAATVMIQGGMRAMMETSFGVGCLTLPFCLVVILFLAGLRGKLGRGAGGRNSPLIFPGDEEASGSKREAVASTRSPEDR